MPTRWGPPSRKCSAADPGCRASETTQDSLPMGGDPDALPVGRPPCSLDPDRIPRRWEPALGSWGGRPDIIRVGASIRRRGMRPVVDHLEKRVSDRIGRTPATLRVTTSAKESEGGDSKNNGNRFSHGRNSRTSHAVNHPSKPADSQMIRRIIFATGRVAELARRAARW